MNITLYDVFDIVAIIFLILIVYHLIKRTEAVQIIMGLLIIFILGLTAHMANFDITYKALKNVSEWLILGLVIILQEEIKMLLKKIGGLIHLEHSVKREIVDNIEEAVFSMSAKGVGALILIDNKKIVVSKAENRVRIDAKCTKELLETIFYPYTPLHDGAVIISDDRIVYARCKLPLSGKKRKDLGDLGTRHLAALENAENFDVTFVVVSEETGNISIVNKKGLHHVEKKEEFRKFFNIEEDKKRWLR